MPEPVTIAAIIGAVTAVATTTTSTIHASTVKAGGKDPLAGAFVNLTPFDWELASGSPKITHGELLEPPSKTVVGLENGVGGPAAVHDGTADLTTPTSYTVFSMKSVGAGSELVMAYTYGRYLLVLYANNPATIGRSNIAGAWLKGISGDWDPAAQTARQEGAAVGSNPEKYSDLIKSKKYGAVVSRNDGFQEQVFGKFKIGVLPAREDTRFTLSWTGDWDHDVSP